MTMPPIAEPNLDLEAIKMHRATLRPERVDDLIAAVEALRKRVGELEVFRDEVMAGCDIQKGASLYRQVLVVIGPGKTQAELNAETAEAHAAELARALSEISYHSVCCDARHTADKALASTPTEALERARAKDEVVRQASELYTRLLVLRHIGKFTPPDKAVAAEFEELGNRLATLDALGWVGAPPLCEGCLKHLADLPSKLCPGCQAYQEHQS